MSAASDKENEQAPVVPDATVSVPESVTAAAGTETTDAATNVKPAGTRWVRLTVLILFGLLYAYDLFEAIGNTLGVSEQIASYNEFIADHSLEPKTVPWGILSTGMALPVVVYVIAWWMGRKHNVLILALLLLVGLSVVAALTLSLTALVAVFPF